MVKDVVTGDCYRADKLLEDHIDDLLEKGNFSSSEADEHRKVQRQADAYSPEELGDILEKYGIKATATGNDLTKPFAFNLMFGTKIGPSGALTGFLRPETAQGLFVNFKRLLDYNNGRVPFAAAQIGLGFRNEIAPKNGLLRVREFTMAEIEHFVRCRRPSTPSTRLVSIRRGFEPIHLCRGRRRGASDRENEHATHRRRTRRSSPTRRSTPSLPMSQT